MDHFNHRDTQEALRKFSPLICQESEEIPFSVFFHRKQSVTSSDGKLNLQNLVEEWKSKFGKMLKLKDKR